MSTEKSAEFVALINQLHSDHKVPYVVDLKMRKCIEVIHTWLMENLDHRDVSAIAGIANAVDRPTSEYAREPFTFKRYATFVHGVMVLDQHLYEFLPGGVYVYSLPGSHLVTLKFPAEHPPLPETLHVHYGSTKPTYVFRQYLDLGWQHLRQMGASWHVMPEIAGKEIPAMLILSAVNGGALRMIYTRFHAILREAQRQHPDLAKIWAGTKPEWFAAIKRVGTSPHHEHLLRDMRDRMRAYDPTHPALIGLYAQIFTLDGKNMTPHQVYERGNEMIDHALRVILVEGTNPMVSTT